MGYATVGVTPAFHFPLFLIGSRVRHRSLFEPNLLTANLLSPIRSGPININIFNPPLFVEGWKIQTNQLVPKNCQQRYGSQLSIGLPIRAEHFHFRILAFRSFTRQPKTVTMPGSRVRECAEDLKRLTDLLVVDTSTLRMPLSTSWNNLPRLVNLLLLA
jgi:hypothetical protein